MNDRDRRLLHLLATGPASGEQLAEATGDELSAVMSRLAALESESLVRLQRHESARYALTPEGEHYVKHGLPERRLHDALEGRELLLDSAISKAGLSAEQGRIALQWVKKQAWVALEKGAGGIKLRALDAPRSSFEDALFQLAAGAEVKNRDATKLLVQRGLASEKIEKRVEASLTPQGETALARASEIGAEGVAQLTPEMLKSGEWRTAKFRAYDAATLSKPVAVGRKHAYKDFLDSIREHLVGLGFREVDAPLTETEFWNMDALFMAQDHPAREIHDVFHLAEPKSGELPDAELVERVRKAHEEGSATSKGWRYSWSAAVAKRLIARSHDTGISARELAAGLRPPQRVFFFAHVFRPDEIDWKHMIEFNQLGGFVMEEGLNFRELVGYLKNFALEMFGATRVKVVPSYYPFTEPSADLVADIPGRGWTEVGGAGLFRPEMLEALGVDVPVLAWGLGIDRLAQFKLGITDIRDLYSKDLEFLHSK